mmetsp:Transcript_31850/g.73578  ORF Transcript_31850/g.73578 Transcript_31850/m.73578 type:complete len:96 (-) Transcript_31850:1022-1309(-)
MPGLPDADAFGEAAGLEPSVAAEAEGAVPAAYFAGATVEDVPPIACSGWTPDAEAALACSGSFVSGHIDCSNVPARCIVPAVAMPTITTSNTTTT